MAYFHYHDAKESKSLSLIGCKNNVILCRPCSDASLNIIVTIYEVKNQYEQTLAYGYIQNIQQNGLIQISIIETATDSLKIEELTSYVDEHIHNIIIKTTATINTLHAISKGELNV